MSVVQLGDRVAIHYRVDDSEGVAVVASPSGQPLILQAGGVDVFHGLSIGVLGMQIGDIKLLQIAADEFGSPLPVLERTIAKDKLPEEVKVGDELLLTMGESQISFWVTAEQWGTAWRVTTQHPLGGKSLAIKFKVVAHQPHEA
jgi:FKBP-type peptidyl-prolyl cis-trans isomerase 2